MLPTIPIPGSDCILKHHNAAATDLIYHNHRWTQDLKKYNYLFVSPLLIIIVKNLRQMLKKPVSSCNSNLITCQLYICLYYFSPLPNLNKIYPGNLWTLAFTSMKVTWPINKRWTTQHQQHIKKTLLQWVCSNTTDCLGLILFMETEGWPNREYLTCYRCRQLIWHPSNKAPIFVLSAQCSPINCK